MPYKEELTVSSAEFERGFSQMNLRVTWVEPYL